ncbi:MAG: PAS domain-containing protein [Candidatus Coatesbacteria bacterium]|nr:PAS domain-containing protein [Candidatus Coatesbacteria bacterium]
MVEPKMAFHLTRELLDDILDGILILNDSGQVIFANSMAISKLTTGTDSMLNRKISELLPAPTEMTWDEAWYQISVQKQRVELNFLSVESIDQREMFFFDASLAPRIGIDGKFAGAVCLLHFASAAEKLAMEVETAKGIIETQLCQLEDFTAIGDEIIGETDLGQVLRRVAETIREHSNFRRVVVSRFTGDEGEREIACAGVTEEEAELLKTRRWSQKIGKDVLRDQFKVGHSSYYVPHDLSDTIPIYGLKSKIPAHEMKDWHPNDCLFIPLFGRGRKMIGLISLDDPRDGRTPTADSLRPLELFASQAARAIDEATLKRELTETKDNLRRLIDSTPDAIIATDAHGVVTFYSDGAKRMFGYQPQEIVGKRLAKFYSDDPKMGLARARKIMEDLMNSPTESITGRILEFPRKSGGRVPVMISAGLLRNESSQVVGTIGAARDISEDIRLRQQIMEKNRKLEAKNAELEEFVYVASHDLQAPLVSIQGFAAKLERESANVLGETGLHCISRLNANVSRMSLLLKSLLELSRASTKALQKDPCDLSRILDDILEDYSDQIDKLGAEIRRLNTLPVVECDGIQIAQVLSNLVGNALKYCADDRPPIIEIGSEGDESSYMIWIKDNGIGIMEDEAETIFLPFKRLRHKTSNGIGIGLSIAQRIIERHGGRIWAEPGQEHGCRFCFELPKERTANN